MEDPKKDADVLSFHSNSEAQFLQQVRECQHHLNCMEKLFLDLQKEESYKEIKKSRTSLNSKLSKSFPDLQLLMHEYESKINSKSDSSMGRPVKKNLESIQVESINSNDDSAALTFVVRVPYTLLESVTRKISSDSLIKRKTEFQRRKGLTWLLRKIFKKKRCNSSAESVQISQDTFQFFQSRNEANEAMESFRNSRECSFGYDAEVVDGDQTEKNFDSVEVVEKSTDSKQSHNLTFPITYNFDGKSSSAAVSPNTICIEHEIKPQTGNSSTFSHSIKIKNELPIADFQVTPRTTRDFSKEEKEAKEEEKQSKIVDQKDSNDFKSTEILVDSLIKALLKTTEKLDNLESIKTLVETLSDDRLTKPKKSDRAGKNFKSKQIKKSNIFNNLLHLKSNENKLLASSTTAINEQKHQMPKRQLSKFSIRSDSMNSGTSDEDIYKSPMTNSRLEHIQKLNRCQSPSMFNYLVCQSERDIDVNSFHRH